MSIKKRIKNIPNISFEPNRQHAVIRSSICTGEQVVGFKDNETGKFTEVMLVRDEKDIEAFKQKYNLDNISKEY